MIITISGFHGTGKSTIGKLLAKKLNLDYYSTGYAFRDLAEEINMTLEEFTIYAEKHPEIDEKLDEKVIKIGQTQDNIVIESLLSSYFLKDIAHFKILLRASLETRIRRMSLRDDSIYNEKIKETEMRERSEIERFKELYNIDIDNEEQKKEIYDMIIDTDNQTIEDVLNNILNTLQKRKLI
ncbi:MAG: cytidylate kinase family protein [Candidatus Lokiarchaeota archaeon]|nr:cytidylate kinase family protein [Candidatus Lokiarchaeota archaeon]